MKNKKLVLSVLSTAVVASMASSAFAAPKAGLYFNNTGKFYELMSVLDLNDSAFAEFKAALTNTSNWDDIVFVKDNGQGAFIEEILNEQNPWDEALVQSDFVASYNVIGEDGNPTGTYKPEVGTPAGELVLNSVTAANAKDIVVDFDDELDAITAEDEANYVIKVNNGTALATSAYTVTVNKDDASKATIVLNTALKTGDYVSVTVKKTVLNKALGALAEDTTKTFSYVDTTAPAVKSVEVKGNDLVVTFDEYVAGIGLITIDNKSFNVPAPGLTFPGQTFTLTGAATGLAAGSHTVAFANVTDLEPTPNNAPYLTKAFDVTVDTAAPTVSKFEATGEYKFKVVFDKEVTSPTVAVKKNGYALNASIAPVDGSGTDDEYEVTVSDNGQVTVYGDSETSAALSVTVSGYKALNNDMYGNQFTNNVTLAKDGAAPAVVTRFSKVNTVSGEEVFDIQFSEELNTTVDASKVILKDKDGVRKAINVGGVSVAADANGKNTILRVVADSVQTSNLINAGTYTIDLGAGAVKDLAGISNAATSVSITKSGSTVGDIDLTQSGDITVASNVITINFGTDMTAAATTLSNYKLNNAALKANAIYFDGGKDTVKIELEDETIASTGNALLTISDNVVAVDGSKLSAASKNIVVGTFTDNVDPVLVSAKKESSTALVLTFSENVTVTDNAAHRDDFVVKVNGTEVAATAISATDNKVTLTLPAYNTAQTVTVATYKENIDTADTTGNKVKVNTSAITAN
ncbi:SwmB domain-containing protein [Brevibacillus migulae]|uniref:SwmB domain-containing protein n=1 Tax=Brevibacillus migulae TaxID=1644114 RepID=UPI00106E2B17|nr:SwmB domain-containing protein [Brevibacillus migulae]